MLIGLLQTASISLDLPFGRLLGLPPAGSDGLLADLWSLTVARAAPAVPYLLLVLVLAFRPRGLFGSRNA